MRHSLRPFAFFVFAAAVSSAGPSRADDWPEWLGGRDGVCARKGCSRSFPRVVRKVWASAARRGLQRTLGR